VRVVYCDENHAFPITTRAATTNLYKRRTRMAMLLVWENADPALRKLHESGQLPPSPTHELARSPA